MWLKRMWYQRRLPSISSTPTREEQLISRVTIRSCRIEGSNDLLGILIQKHFHFPDDLRPGQRWQRHHRFPIMAYPPHQESYWQRFTSKHRQSVRTLRWRKDRLPLVEKFTPSRPGIRRKRVWKRTAGADGPRWHQFRRPRFIGGVLPDSHKRGKERMMAFAFIDWETARI